MGTVSVNKLGGYSVMLGPIIALIGYFLQPGGMLIDAADPANATASLMAITSNSTLGTVTGIVISLGLIIFLYGLFVVRENVAAKGNGSALAGYGTQFLMIGIIGWVISSGLNSAIAGSSLAVASEAAAAGALYAATLGIGAISGLLAGLGFLALALAISTRDDSNKIFALVAAVVAIVVVIAVLVGGFDSAQLEAMQPVIGVCYLIHCAWLITLGLGLINKE